MCACSPLGSDDVPSGDTETGEPSKGVELDLADEDEDDERSPAIDVSRAITLLSSKGGRSVSAKADHTPKDAYMGFLLLRHLKIREVQAKVGHVPMCQPIPPDV